MNDAGLTAVMQAANLGHNEFVNVILKHLQSTTKQRKQGAQAAEEGGEENVHVEGDTSLEQDMEAALEQGDEVDIEVEYVQAPPENEGE